MGKPKDLTGQRFGRLVAIEPTEERVSRHIVWKCRCDCGRLHYVSSNKLLYGESRSCGCLRKEIVTERISKVRDKVIKHNMYATRLYGIWAGMKDRCYNPNNKKYKHYGGRGITVCDEWRNDFQAFYDWAMANGYDENAPRGQCTLDRINVDSNYCPDNCRWVDMKTQNNNKRNSKKEKEDGRNN